MATSVFIPCETNQVTVILAPKDGLSLLEQHLLRAVDRGLKRFEELNTVFNVGHRTLMGLVHGLWRQGYLQLDLDSGDLELIQGVAKQLLSGDLKDFESGDQEAVELLLMQEKVTGHLLRVTPQVFNRNVYRTVPQQISNGGWSNIPAEQVLPLLERLVMTSKGIQYEGRRIVSWRYGSREGITTNTSFGQRRLMEVGLTIEHGFSSTPNVRIITPLELLPVVRQDLERAIEHLLSEGEEAPTPIVKYLREQTQDRDASALYADGILEHHLTELRHVVDRWAPSSDPLDSSTLRSNHTAWNLLANQVRAGLELRWSGRMEIAILSNQQAIWQAVGELIPQARKRIILCMPRPHWPTFNREMYPLLKRLFDESLPRSKNSLGKKKEPQAMVWLFWGIHSQDRVTPEFQAGMDALTKESKGRFFWTPESSSVQANLVMVDDMKVVFSTGHLGEMTTPVMQGMEPLGIRLEAPQSNISSPMLDSLLGWLNSKYPDWENAPYNQSHISLNKRDAEAPDEEASDAVWAWLPNPPALPHWVENEKNTEEDRKDSSTQANSRKCIPENQFWWKCWDNYQKTCSELTRVENRAEWVFHMHRHRELLFKAASKARYRLFFNSRNPQADIFNNTLRDLLLEAAGRDVQVVLAFSESQVYSHWIRSCLDMFQQVPNIQVIFQSCVGGVILWDDQCLLGGLDLLSWRMIQEPGWRHRQQDIGLLVQGNVITNTIWSHLIPVFSVKHIQDEPPADVHATLRTFDRDLSQQKVLTELTLAETTSEHVEILVRWFAKQGEQPSDHWQNLEFLQGHLKEQSWRYALAAALRASSKAMDDPSYHHMRRLLAENLWHDHIYMEASLLLERGDDDTPSNQRPPIRLASLAAAYCSPSHQVSLLHSFSDDWPTSMNMRLSLFFLASLGMLRDGLEETWYLLEGIPDNDWPNPWQEWRKEILNYWTNCGQRMPPLDDMAGIYSNDLYTEAWELFQQAQAADARYPIGRKIWKRLFMPNGPMGKLGTCLEKKELANVQTWLDEKWSTDYLIDWGYHQLQQESKNFSGSPIDMPQRRSMSNRLDKTKEKVHQWVKSNGKDRDGDTNVASATNLIHTLLGDSEQSWEKLSHVQSAIIKWVENRDFVAPLAADLFHWLKRYTTRS